VETLHNQPYELFAYYNEKENLFHILKFWVEKNFQDEYLA